jgi:hypothetical protein
VLHYLAIWWYYKAAKKITHVHESPIYHYTQFPHPFVITYSGRKYSQILFGQTMHTIQKNTEALIDVSKEVGLEVNTKKSKYMLQGKVMT